MGPTVSLSLREGDPVLVRGKIEFPSERSALVRIITDINGNQRRITVPYGELFLADYTTNGAYEAARVLMQRLEQTQEIAARVVAEIYELGLHAGDARQGLVLG
jgi:hypothetical protein